MTFVLKGLVLASGDQVLPQQKKNISSACDSLINEKHVTFGNLTKCTKNLGQHFSFTE